jgi:hypothetical protein
LILDDVVNDIRKNNKGVDKVLAKILYNRRHITADGGDEANGVTVWLTTHSWNRIPLMVRKVANGWIAFKLKNVKEILSKNTADNVIASASNLIKLINETYDADTSADLTKRFINSIRTQDEMKFRRGIRKANESKRHTGK